MFVNRIFLLKCNELSLLVLLSVAEDIAEEPSLFWYSFVFTMKESEHCCKDSNLKIWSPSPPAVVI